jgi:hypothetical protein
MIIPFFKLPPVDGIEALMSFDRDTAKRHTCFARDFSALDLPANSDHDYFGRQMSDEFTQELQSLKSGAAEQNVTVVKQITPGVRVRFCLYVEWPGQERNGVSLPDDYFDQNGPYQRVVAAYLRQMEQEKTNEAAGAA